MILRVPDRVTVLQEALDGSGEFAPIGVEDGEVQQSRVPLRWRCASLAVPRVQGYVVMVASGREEDVFVVRTVGGDAEAKHIAVEARRFIEVGYAQVHVADTHRRVKL